MNLKFSFLNCFPFQSDNERILENMFEDDGLSLDQIDELFETFSLFDKDYNGALSAKELAVVMKSINMYPTEDEAHDMIKEGETTDDQLIDFPEFVSILARAALNSTGLDESHRSQIISSSKSAFELLADESGFITSRSLSRALNKVNEKVDEEAIQKLIDQSSIYHVNSGNKLVLGKEDFNCLLESVYHFDLNQQEENSEQTEQL